MLCVWVCVFYEKAPSYLPQSCRIHFCPGTEVTVYICSQEKMKAQKVWMDVYLIYGIMDIWRITTIYFLMEHHLEIASNGFTVSRAACPYIKLTKSYSLHVATYKVIIGVLKLWTINYKRENCCASISWCLVVIMWPLLCTCIYEVAGCSACFVMLRVPLALIIQQAEQPTTSYIHAYRRNRVVTTQKHDMEA
jgi:hypothetical protein